MAQKSNKKSNNVFVISMFAFVAIIGLYASNPTVGDFKKIMRMQDKLVTDVASHLPIERTDYKLFSKFDIKYVIGKKTCYGAASYVFFCPNGTKAGTKAA